MQISWNIGHQTVNLLEEVFIHICSQRHLIPDQFLFNTPELNASASYNPSTPSPLRKHVPHRAPVLRGNERLDLALGQPLESLVTVDTLADVCLAGHDASLHEEDLLAELLLLVGVCLDLAFRRLVVREVADLGLGVGVIVVSDWVVADDPGVHVETGGLDDDALGGLVGFGLVSRTSSSKRQESLPCASPPSRTACPRGTSTGPACSAQASTKSGPACGSG